MYPTRNEAMRLHLAMTNQPEYVLHIHSMAKALMVMLATLIQRMKKPN